VHYTVADVLYVNRCSTHTVDGPCSTGLFISSGPLILNPMAKIGVQDTILFIRAFPQRGTGSQSLLQVGVRASCVSLATPEFGPAASMLGRLTVLSLLPLRLDIQYTKQCKR
jgi:hypothetical protein